MAARSWAGSTVTAIGVAAGAGAAQLGIGYGLGIVAWLPEDNEVSRVTWVASLAWVVWIAATATAVGAVVADRVFRGSRTERSGFVLVLWRITIALGAAIGAAVTAPLAAIPARLVSRPDNFAPEWTVAGYAVVGVVLGLLVAVAVLSARAIAANVLVSSIYLWLLALVTAIDQLRTSAEQPLARLAIWEFTPGPIVRDYYVPGILVLVLVPFLIGIFASLPAGLRGDGKVGVAISGAVGPLLVAAAYLLAAPRFAGEDRIDQPLWSAYLFAPYAVILGLAGSVLAAAVGDGSRPGPLPWRRQKPAAAVEPAVDTDPPLGSEPHTDDAASDELTDWPAALSRDPVSVSKPVLPDADLDDDAYAPARAYRSGDRDNSAYVSDTADPPAEAAESKTPTKATKATGRATPAKATPAKAAPTKATGQAAPPRNPLWPDPPTSR